MQSVVARFHSADFEAAAVTSIDMMSLGSEGFEAAFPWVRFELDRPFGFLAVHRPTNLVLFAGWVTTPASVTAAGPE